MTKLELICVFKRLQQALLSENISLMRTVLEHNVALAVAAELPRFNEENVVFPDPERSLQASGDSADAHFAVEASDAQMTSAQPLFANAKNLSFARQRRATDFFRLLLLLRFRSFSCIQALVVASHTLSSPE